MTPRRSEVESKKASSILEKKMAECNEISGALW